MALASRWHSISGHFRPYTSLGTGTWAPTFLNPLYSRLLGPNPARNMGPHVPENRTRGFSPIRQNPYWSPNDSLFHAQGRKKRGTEALSRQKNENEHTKENRQIPTTPKTTLGQERGPPRSGGRNPPDLRPAGDEHTSSRQQTAMPPDS